MFSYEDEYYVFGSLEPHIWPQTCWEEIFNPHDITYRETQQDILNFALTEKNAYQISDYVWQFKSTRNMSLQLDSEPNGFLKDTLGSAQVKYVDGQTLFFIAEDHTQF